jgi:hypothetical protein
MAALASVEQTTTIQQHDNDLYLELLLQIKRKGTTAGSVALQTWKKDCVTVTIRYLCTMVHIVIGPVLPILTGLLGQFLNQLPTMSETDVSSELERIGRIFYRYTELHTDHPSVTQFDLDTYLRLSRLCLQSIPPDHMGNWETAVEIDKTHHQRQFGMGMAAAVLADYAEHGPRPEQKEDENDIDDFVMVQPPETTVNRIWRETAGAGNVMREAVARGATTVSKGATQASSSIGTLSSFVRELFKRKSGRKIKRNHNNKKSKKHVRKQNRIKNKKRHH